MRTAQVYIQGQKLDLFDDENISVTSSIQNISDISKVFTDFSQSFNVPASKNNNTIFSHWYNNDLDEGFSAKDRVASSIEINNAPFRIGKMQLEGAEIKNNKAQSYRLTFFGDVVTLKDLLSSKKLADLDLTGLQLDAAHSNILSNISDTTDLDYRFPLISSDRIWNYGETGANDISISGGAIDTSELFPAIKVSKIFEAIEAEAGVTFTGLFLTDKRFTNLFTLWKNQKESTLYREEVPITFVNPDAIIFQTPANIETDSISYNMFGWSQSLAFPGAPIDGAQQLELWFDSANVGSTVTFTLYKTSNSTPNVTVVHTTRDITITAGTITVLPMILDDIGAKYTLSFVSADTVTIDNVAMKWSAEAYATQSGAVVYGSTEINIPDPNIPSTVDNSFTTTPYTNLVLSAPDMLLTEYFSGILKMFNLTCFSTQDGNFQIEPLQDWYNYGGELNITEYTIDDSIKIDRPKLYKSIEFEYKECKSFLNQGFKSLFDREYGNLKESFPLDSGDFKVKLPFENLYFQRFTGTDLQVAYSMDKAEAGSSYVPAVTNLYLNEDKTSSFYVTDGFTPALVTNYMPLGQDMEYNLEPHTINFGLDNSTMTDVSVQNSLYWVYYRDYLESLFNEKTRKVTLKCILPLSKLTMLTLDDSIILRDKKYRIESMKTNLTTGVVDLVLLSNWVDSENGEVVVGPSGPVRPVRPIRPNGGTIIHPVRPVKPSPPTKPYGGGGGKYKIEKISGTYTTTNLTLPYNGTDPVNLEITSGTNSTGSFRTDEFLITYYEPDGTTVVGTETILVNQEPEIFYLLQENGDFILQENYSKIII
jgi:hypothetical protein